MKKLHPVYFALDFPTGKEALTFIQKNELEGIPLKVGMELFYKEGSSIIQQLKENKHPIFLDLKLHDIPVTVQRAMANLARLDVDVVNVHAQGGGKMIEAARLGLEQGSDEERPLLLAVTILTSTDETMVGEELMLKKSLDEMVTHYSRLASENGADGVVCSVRESAAIKQALDRSFMTLTPGIRLPGNDSHDQKRIATPADAKRAESDSIVVGRSIRDAENPRHTYELLKEEFIHGSTTYS
ncbi:orotidine-5'-phosphate decarboxylase [Halobacillus yeomjeoni]|uniref:Orotidine 5'-phosphate decarboxylase n=1 Tax=Halobacillus yeomjeoni TaxID=311194 RepID=A0A931HSM2_9BACI|nr:orotidine-5'-phosphate decarboxylase [Halobacillus yeomjeoni]MBH0229082.1 orotidine-5'-phosphate decarboxylase [Halobacillus yeomjeoni]